MADEQNQHEQEQKHENQGDGQQGGEQQAKTYTAEEVQALLEKETGGLKSKLEELLGESKSAKQKARELEEQRERERQDRLKEQGEFKSLYEQTLEQLETERQNAQKYQQSVRQAEINRSAAILAGELTRDAKRGELLAEKAQSYAKYGDDGKIHYEMGGIEVDKAKVIDHLKAEYPFLVDGNGSSGGGAPSGKHGGGAAGKKFNEMTGAELSQLRQSDPGEYQRLRDEFHRR